MSMSKYRVKSIIVTPDGQIVGKTNTESFTSEHSAASRAVATYKNALINAVNHDTLPIAFDIRLEEMRANGTWRVLHRSTF